MPRHPNWGKLPPHADRLFADGMSYAALGARYGLSASTVRQTLKSRARRAGAPWPAERSVVPSSARPRDTVSSLLIRAEVAEVCVKRDVTKRDVAKRAGISVSTLYKSGRRRVDRLTAERVMVAVAAIESRRGKVKTRSRR
ncbi:MAG: hypothetical protein QOC92_4487 [Acidimicrobiaceae bacterium]|jgi:transposase